MDQVKIEFGGITVVFAVEYLRYLSSDHGMKLKSFEPAQELAPYHWS